MSQNVDERVVEMKFDNKEFEKNISESIESLENLKKALQIDQTSKSLQDITAKLDNLSKVNFTKLTEAADSIKKKFSLIGTVVDEITRKMTDKLIGSASKIWSNSIGQIISGGQARAENLAKAKFTMEGLIGTGEKLDEVMTSVKNSVDGTAYSLDAAAGVASNLLSSGIDGGQEMENVLKAVAGTAAMTGSSFEDIGHIFTTVAANGRLMGEQVNQFAYRNLNVAAQIGKQLGKTEEEVKTMVSKGQIDFKTFANAMNEAFGEHAKKANETYAGSLSNLKSALSRIGADIAAERMTALTKVFNALRIRVNQIHTALQPTIETITKMIKLAGLAAESFINSSFFTKFIPTAVGILTNVFYDLVGVLYYVGKGISEAFPDGLGDTINTVASAVLSFVQALFPSEEVGEKIASVAKGIMSILVGIAKILKGLSPILTPIFRILGMIGNVAIFALGQLGELLNKFGDFLQETNAVSNALNMIGKAATFLGKGALGLLLGAIDKIGGAFEKLRGIFTKDSALSGGGGGGADGATGFIGGLTNAFNSGTTVIDKFIKVLNYCFNQVKNFTSSIDWSAGIAGIFDGIANVVHQSWDLVWGFLEKLTNGKTVIIAFSLAVIFLIRTLQQTFGIFGQIGQLITGTLKSVQGLLGAGQKLIEAHLNEMKSDNFLKIAAGIALMAASLAALTFVIKDTDVEKFERIALAMTIFVGVTLLMSRIVGSSYAAAAALGAMSLAVIALWFAFDRINRIAISDGVVDKLIYIGAIIAGIIALGMILTRLHVDFNNVALVSMAATLYVAVMSLERLNNLQLDGLQQKMEALTLAFLGLIGLIMVARGIPLWNSLPILVAAFALRTAAQAVVDIFNGMDVSKIEEIVKMLEKYQLAFSSVAKWVAALIATMLSLAPLLNALGSAFLSVAAGFALITFVLHAMPVDAGTYAVGIAAVVGFLGAILGMVAFMQRVLDESIIESAQNASKAFLAIAGAIFVMSLVVIMLSKFMAPVEYIGPIFAIVMLCLGLNWVISACKNIEDGAAPAIESVIKLLLVIVGLIAFLALIPWDENSLRAAGIGFVMVALVVLLLGRLFEAIGSIGDASKSVIAIIAMVMVTILAIAGMALGITYLLDSWEKVAAAAVAFAGIIITLAVLSDVFDALSTLSEKTSGKKKFNWNIFAQLGLIFVGIIGILFMATRLAAQGWGLIGAIVIILEVSDMIRNVIMPLMTNLTALNKKKFNANIAAQLGIIFLGIILILGMAALIAGQGLWSALGATAVIAAVMYLMQTAVLPLMTTLSSLSKKKFNVNVISQLGTIMLGLTTITAAAALVAHAGLGGAIGATAVIVALAGLMDTGIIPLMTSLSSLTNKQFNINVISQLGAIMVGLTTITAAAALVAHSGFGGSVGAAGVLMALAGLMDIGIIPLMTALGNMSKKQFNLNAISQLGAIFLGITAILIPVAAMASNGWESIVAAGATMSALVGLIGVGLAPLMEQLMNIPQKALNTTLLVNMGAVIVSIYTIADNIMHLADFDGGKLAAASVSLSALTAVFGAAVYFLSNLQSVKITPAVYVNMAAVLASMYLMGKMLEGLSGYDWGGIIASTFALSLVLAALTASVVVLGNMSGDLSKSIGSAIALVVVSFSLGNVAEALKKLSKYKWDSILAAAFGMSLVIAAMGFAIGVLGSIASNVMTIVGMLAAGGAMIMAFYGLALLADAMASMCQYSWIEILATMMNLSIVIFMVGGILTVLGALGGTILGAVGLVAAGGALLMTFQGLALLADAMASMCQYSWIEILATMVNLSIVIFMVGGILFILGALGATVLGAVGLVAAGGALLMTLYGMAMMAEAMSKLCQYDWGTILVVMVAFSAVMLVLAVIVAILGLIGATGIGAVGMVAGAVSILILAFAIKVLAEAIQIVADVLYGVYSVIASACEDISSAFLGMSDSTSKSANLIVSAIETVNDFIPISIFNFKKRMGQLSSLFGSAADENIDGYVESLEDGYGRVADAGYKVGETACEATREAQDSNSPSKVMRQLGLDNVAGFLEGLEEKYPELQDVTVENIGEFIDKFKRGEYGEIPDDIMEDINNMIASGGLKTLSTADDFLGALKAKVMSGLSILDDISNYGNDHATKSKLKTIEKTRARIEARYKAGKITDDQYNKYISRLNNKAPKTGVEGWIDSMTSKYAEPVMDTVKDTVSDLTDGFSDLGSASTGAAGGMGSAGSAAEAAGEQAKHSLKSWEDLKTSISDSIDSSIDIFSEFERKTELTGDQLLSNMRSQVEGVAEWSNGLTTLAGRGMNSLLLQELTELGPQGYEKVNAFLQMTDDQLNEANSLYVQRLALPDAAADKIVGGFADAGMWATEGFVDGVNYESAYQCSKEFADSAITALNETLQISSPSKVTEEIGRYFVEGFLFAMEHKVILNRALKAGANIAKYAVEGIGRVMGSTNLKTSSDSAIGKFIGGIVDASGKLTKPTMAMCNKLIKVMKDNLPEKTFFKMGEDIIKWFQEGMLKSADTLEEEIKKLTEKLEKNFEKSFIKVGEYAAEGLAAGIKNKITKVTKVSKEMTSAAYEEAKKSIESNSPSRLFMQLGEYITLGLAIGITNMQGEATSAISSVASNTIEKFQNAVSMIQDMADFESEDMVLTPVLDLSQVESGLATVGSMFQNQTVDIGASITRVNAAAKAFDSMRAVNVAGKESNVVNNYTTFNQNNTSPKALTNAEIYRQTNNLISVFRNR